MHTNDPSTPDVYDEHCLVHHFIRTTGRRPTVDELRALREQPSVPRPRGAVVADAIPQALRREVARLIHRL
jgi:hypothetical protein